MAKFDQKMLITTPGKNVFDLSYRSRLSAIMGQLIPVLNKEIIPGDRWRVSLDSLIRLAPLKAPIFDGVKADFHAFFVPNRILDPKWKEFITDGNSLDVGQVSYDDDTRPAPLSFNVSYYLGASSQDGENRGFHLSGLFDYLNLHVANYKSDGSAYHTLSGVSFSLSALPVLGYHKIWSDWYRNERVENGIALGGDNFESLSLHTGNDRLVMYLYPVGTTEETASLSNYFDRLHYRNYKKDRYTTALPEPVIGGPVMIPGQSSFEGTGTASIETAASDLYLKGSDSKDYVLFTRNEITPGSPIDLGINSSAPTIPSGVYPFVKFADQVPVVMQIANAAQATIQELKTAFKMYSFFMKDTYNGNRYVEFMQSHHNVRVPDATVDRSIFLGKMTVPIRFGEVFQTSGNTGEVSSGVYSNSLGDYAGRGVGAGSGFMFDETFLEHGQLYIIMSIVPDNTYFQGIDPKFLKNDRFDYFFPEFQNIGDVAIKDIELYFGAGGSFGDKTFPITNPEDVFGYQSRWHEYKRFNNELHGDFIPVNNEYGTNMSFWNFSRLFSSAPKISPEFSNVKPINSPFVNIREWSDNYLIDLQFNIKALRQIMYYETF